MELVSIRTVILSVGTFRGSLTLIAMGWWLINLLVFNSLHLWVYSLFIIRDVNFNRGVECCTLFGYFMSSFVSS